MTQALEAFQEALAGGADDDALDVAAEDVRRDSGAAALVEALKMRIAHEAGRGKTDLELTALRYRLAGALEDVAKGASPAEPTAKDAAKAALEAAELQRGVLHDEDGAKRNFVNALRLAANDDATLRHAVEVAGGRDAAEGVVEKALKRPEVKADAPQTALLRRALARIAETHGDTERAFFEAMKAARKNPSDGMFVDEVFRLALETTRFTEAGAFFGALADDESLAARQRASLYNKLGQTLERAGGESAKALEAYTKSLAQHETKAAKRAVERLSADVGVESPQAPIEPQEPVEVTPPFDHKTGSVTQEAALPDRAQAPAEVTIPRYPMSMRTAELEDAVPPPDSQGPGAAPVDEAPVERQANDTTAPTPTAPRPISVPPTPSETGAAHSVASQPPMSQEPGFSIANLPSFDDEPALTPSHTVTPFSPVERVEVPSFDAPVVEAPWSAKESSPFSMPPVEGGLRDRAEPPEEPTNRAALAAVTAVNSSEGTAEHPSGKRKPSKDKKRKKRGKKKTTAQKAAAPRAPAQDASGGELSQVDGAAMPPPDGSPVAPPAEIPAPRCPASTTSASRGPTIAPP